MSSVLRMLVFGLLILMSGIPAQARHDKPKAISAFGLLPSDKQHVLQDHFVVVKTVQAIPKSVSCRLLGKYIEDGMADAGQPYEHSDAPPPGPRLPLRGLIFAALSPGYCIVANNHGGFGEGTEVSLYRLPAASAAGTPAALVWRANWRPASGYPNLLELQRDITRELNDTYKDRDDINKARLPETKPEDYLNEPARGW